LKQYPLYDIEILEPDAESSFPPRRVRTPDGAVYGFKACVKDATRPPTNHVENHHKDAIHAYLALHKEPLGVPGIPSVAGVVVDEGALAGVLLEDIEGAQNLPSRLETVATVEGVERVRGLVPGWRARIEAVVERLHSRGFCLNKEVSQSSLDESLLIVDKDDCIWLPLSSIFQMDEDREELRTHVNKDKEAVRQILEQYVLEELMKVETRVEVE
jgi:dsDNA-binding SOS-regulon protein